MGGFEIILIAIGIGWTVISGVIKSIEDSKKKKAMKEADAPAADAAFESQPVEPVPAPEPQVQLRADSKASRPKVLDRFEELRKKRIEQLRRRMGIESAAPKSTPTPPSAPKPAPVSRAAAPDPVQAAAASEPARSPRRRAAGRPEDAAEARGRILALARSSHGLKDAIILSELLAPPVAIRDDHLS